MDVKQNSPVDPAELAKQLRHMADHTGLDAVAELMRQAASVIESLQQPAPQRCQYCDDTGDVIDQIGEWRGRCICPAGQQPAPQPLTDEQIRRIYEVPELAGSYFEDGTEKAIALARAIERAHGIKEQP